jgi:murein DD-endopeptidase MepM/ murein hydrolase activator NlpD
MSGMAKLGLHILGGFGGGLGRPRIVKLVDASVEYIRQVRALVGDGCALIVRWTEPSQPLDDPVRRAREWYDRRRPSMVDTGAYYEGYNEIADSQAGAFAAFEVERLRLMHAGGRRCAVGSWSVGCPDIPVWAVYAPVLSAMYATDAVSLHEYWSHAADLGNPWHVGRWRLVPELVGKQIAVTECGRDVVEGRGYSGWKRDPTLTANGYLRELREYNALVETAPNVLGATIFTAGQIVDPQWAPFSINEIAPTITAESTQDAPVVVPPTPEPPTPTPPTENADGRLIIELARPLALTPATNKVTQWFGENPQMYAQFGMAGHNGLDYRAPEGTPVLAAHPGIVRVYDEGSKGLGKYVKVTYIDGAGAQRYTTYYAHLSEHKVVMAQRVKRGDVLGLSGNTGNSTGAHLHFGLKVVGMVNPAYNDAIDPVPWRTL